MKFGHPNFSVRSNLPLTFRIKFSISNKEERVEEPVKTILRLVWEYKTARSVHAQTGQPETRGEQEGWMAPPQGWLKLNVDGASCRYTNNASVAGIFRDDKGMWVKGFCKQLGVCSSTSAEMWAIYEGLKLARELQFDKLMVESDAMEVIQLIQARLDGTEDIVENPLVEQIALMAQEGWCVLFRAVPRGSNKCAEILAKEALNSTQDIQILSSPYVSLCMQLYADYANVHGY